MRSRCAAQVRLLCLPCAGGSAAAYASWARALPDDIAVWALELPGRGALFRTPALRSMTALADFVSAACANGDDRPLVLFGHSMGAVLACEVARRLAAAGAAPAALIVAGSRAPHLAPARSRPLFDLPAAALLDELKQMGGLPPGLAEMPGLLDVFLPTIRADLQCREQWQAPAGAMPVPIHVLGGRTDPLVRRADLDAWASYSTQPVAVTLFEGGHFFIRQSEPGVLACVEQVVRASARHSTVQPTVRVFPCQ